MRRKLILWGLVLCALGLAWVLFVLAQIGSVERNPAVSAGFSQPADVGIVLGASLWGDVPSPGLQERLEQSIQDYKAGKFKLFLLTGGRDTPNSKYTEAEGMANYLERRGIPQEKILLENEATSTFENLKFSKTIMEEHGYDSALIITHTYHGNRALEIAEAFGYHDPKLSLKKSQVLKPIPNTVREILAYTKWKMDQLVLAFGRG
ncbi:YdcF family protein [Paenibacillus macerans]|uniref:YdcF family protein n=1 Tax=Paenibacillus macerans TaxID=44252 RepID=UPI00203C669F|nr:YdcF family protein [Paenibacillus macerans]MCM3702758.1 YdcF family protein [Paenibacillus macerans]